MRHVAIALTLSSIAAFAYAHNIEDGVDPKDASAFTSRANAWSSSVSLDKAIADYTEAVRLDPKDVFAYKMRASLWEAKGNYENAIADYKHFVRLKPKDALAYINIAWVRATCPDARFRDGKKSIEYAKKACDLTKWKGDLSLMALAAAYAEAGDFKQAMLKSAHHATSVNTRFAA